MNSRGPKTEPYGTPLTTSTHCENSHFKAKYEMNGNFLDEDTEERDLGVIMQSDLKCSSQCIGLLSDSVLNVRKHIFEWKHRKSSRNFSLIVNK